MKIDLITNFLGRAANVILSVIFTPIIVKILGIESYGLIAVFNTLFALSAIFDFGLGMTINREFAQLSNQDERKTEMHSLLRTFEIPYGIIGCLIGLAIYLISPVFLNSWVAKGQISQEILKNALFFISASVVVQWPTTLYSNGLMGLHKHVVSNAINIIFACLRTFGTIFFLLFLSPTLQVFFVWQIVIGFMQTLVLRQVLKHALPLDAAPQFNPEFLRKVKYFAISASASSILAIILTQLDKFMLSRMISLKDFGYYCLASSVSLGLQFLTSPFFSIFYPRFSQLVGSFDHEGLIDVYRKGAQLLSIVVFPVACLIFLFPHELLILWTGNEELTFKITPLVRVLIIGSALNGLAQIPYAIPLAHGQLRFALVQNFISVLIFIPLVILGVRVAGPIGAAYAWVALNCGYILIGVFLIHRKYLPNEASYWYTHAFILPLSSSLAITAFARYFLPLPSTPFFLVLYFITILILSFFVGYLSSPLVRQWRKKHA